MFFKTIPHSKVRRLVGLEAGEAILAGLKSESSTTPEGERERETKSETRVIRHFYYINCIQRVPQKKGVKESNFFFFSDL